MQDKCVYKDTQDCTILMIRFTLAWLSSEFISPRNRGFIRDPSKGKLVENILEEDDIDYIKKIKILSIIKRMGKILDSLKFIQEGFYGRNKEVVLDVASLTNFFQNNCGITPEEKQLSVSGRNWGEVDLNGW
ncbi:hypothetical protein REPUB_Repub07fG0128700 [Reevesia pubescens]